MNTKNEIDKNLEDILSAKFAFNIDEYADLINNTVAIDKSSKGIYFLNEMSKSDDYAIIFALSFILEHASREFLMQNREAIVKIIINAINKNYERANFYFSESLLYTMKDDDDYISYIHLLIKSKYNSVQQISLMNIFKLSDQDLQIFDRLSTDLDFSYLYEKYHTVNDYLMICENSHHSILQKKIICMGYYKFHKDKSETYKLLGDKNPELFDFIFFLP